MKLLVVNNLASGPADGAVYDFARAFTQDGDELLIRTTDGTTDICSLLADASDFDLVVASGGDGTISTVCHALANTNIPVLPYPAGTANLLALNLESPTESHALAKLARSPQTLDFDLGEIIAQNTRYGFAFMAGAGYDATIMNDAQASKHVLGIFAYFSAALNNPLPQRSDIVIETDTTTKTVRGIGVLVVNFSKLQLDIPITHNNSPRDGLLDIVILKTENAFGLIPALGAAFLDREGDFPNRTDALEIFQVRHARIDANPPLNIQYDGEIINATTPFCVRVLPRATRLVISEEGYTRFSSEANLATSSIGETQRKPFLSSSDKKHTSPQQR